MKRVAIVGTQGVPAKYGGFETLVENIIGENCARALNIRSFARQRTMKRNGPDIREPG